MKKKIVAALACLALVFGVFTASVQETKATSDDYLPYYTWNNAGKVIEEKDYPAYMMAEARADLEDDLELTEEEIQSKLTEWYGIGLAQDVFVRKLLCGQFTLGSILKAGDVITYDKFESDLAYVDFIFSTTGVGPESDLTCAIREDAYWDAVEAYTYYGDDESSYYNYIGFADDAAKRITVPEIAGVKAWRIYSVFMPDGMPDPYIFCVPVTEYALVTDGNTTMWVDAKGNVVWTITEEDAQITADLSDWAAINADTVNSWNASGKALDITYKYNGYTVSISLPAGEALANTGAEWYGPEYLAAVNQKYVVVKDATGLVVPNDRIYKK